MIIAILNEKGGVGKTTLSTNIARCLKRMDKSVLLVDSDPQGSARDWHVNSDGSILDVVALDRSTLDKDIVKFKSEYVYIIIDGAPQLKTMAVKAICCADLVLIPVQPSPYDVWATAGIVDLVKQRIEITNGKLKAAFVISQQIVNSKLGREVRMALDEYELPVLINGTCKRVVYAESASRGMTVLEEKDKLAISEIEAITEELLEFMQ